MKRGTKILTGLATAGMLAAVSAIGIQSVGGTTTTETVEYTMEENLSDGLFHVPVTGMDQITDYKYLSDLEKSLPSGYGYKRIYVKGYDAPVLMVCNPDKLIQTTDSCMGIHAKIYTEKSGRNVKCIGEIYTDGPIRMVDGLLYCNGLEGAGGNGGTVVDTSRYTVSNDGERLIVKDYITYKFVGLVDYYGFTNHDGNNNYHALTNLNETYEVSSKWLEEYRNSGEVLEYNVKQ